MYVVLIETSGNQDYIFATNKLRENVGASELTYQVGTKFVIEVIGGRGYEYDKDRSGNSLRRMLLAETPLEAPGNQNDEEIIVATSGKAVLLTKSEERAKEIIREVTKRSLKEMPGITVHGAIEKLEDTFTASQVHKAVAKVHHRLESLRFKIPSNQERFQRLPHVEPCATSGLPADEIYRHESLKGKENEWKPHSALSLTKQECSEAGRRRLEGTVRFLNHNVHLASSINNLEKTFDETKWIAIIHADGNGLGEIFLNFQAYSDAQSGRDYVNWYRAFSIALDVCTLNAAAVAISNFQTSFAKNRKNKESDTIEIPLLPLILGGDDLTVICDGQYAIKFAFDFLQEFERQTANLDSHELFTEITSKLPKRLIARVANNAFGNKSPDDPLVERLGICAGVAIVKPHYPFHQAYELAEKLLRSAKEVKSKITHRPMGSEVPLPCSAIDFHVLYDSSGIELADIRKSLLVDHGGTYLYAKPYIVTPIEQLKKSLKFENGQFTNRWLNSRTWNQLEDRVCAIAEEDEDGGRKLPNSQMHHIRESLHRGKGETDSEVELFSHRYRSQGFKRLLAEKGSLFFKDDGENGTTRSATHFLDALDAVDFWKGFECRKEKNSDGSAKEHQDGGVE